MKEVERLRIENQELRNVVACALERIEIGDRLGEECYVLLGSVQGHLESYEKRIKESLKIGHALDYRYNAKTLGECETIFERWGDRVILNDGMVMGMEY